jgi:hypothetical protein
MTEVNVELLKKLYEWAVASHEGLEEFFLKNPGYAEHRQSAWGQAVKNGTCQTAFCLAGQVAVKNGYTFVINDQTEWDTRRDGPENHVVKVHVNDGTMVPTSLVHGLGLKFVKGSGKTFAHGNGNFVSETFENAVVHAPEVAMEILGINESEADRLFNGGNNVDDIECIINEIFANHLVNATVGSGRMWESWYGEEE